MNRSRLLTAFLSFALVAAAGCYSNFQHDSRQSHHYPAPACEMMAAKPYAMKFSADAAYQAPLSPVPQDQYVHARDNQFVSPLVSPLSTFSVDVDTASYTNMRRFINEGHLPPADAVRIEEMLNYFSYDYAPPKVLKKGESIGDTPPFAVHTEICACPWEPTHKLLRIGIKGAEVEMSERPKAHLIFLLDVSGSMDEADKLPLAKAALIRLLAQLRADDHVSLVVYAGASGCVLENASCADKTKILGALDRLGAGGSTAGAQGINQAYEVAQKHFIRGGVNRVILCTDGDFNVGVSGTDELIRLAKEKANPKNGRGVFLSACGFGRGNLNDYMMEQVADAGNGNYAYIDSLAEAEKVFVKQVGGTLITIAKDVKLQLEFNPAKVGQYRLIGYENRILQAQDFNDDTVDAGDIGAGHTVTALYEIAPAGAKEDRSVDPLVFQGEHQHKAGQISDDGELVVLKLRHKRPTDKAKQGTSRLQTFTVKDADMPFEKASADTRFATCVAAYGMILRDSKFKGDATLRWVEKTATGALGDKSGADASEQMAQRSEFVALVHKARRLK